jgi:serine/threonine protein kinase
MTPVPPALEPGMTVGRYRVLSQLGRGAMGGVWEVEDPTGARFALKSPAGVTNGDAAKRFAREANALRMLDHPNLVAALDLFVEGRGLYLVMEKVSGQTLTDVIAAGRLHPRRALVLARQLLDGIGHAHAHGIVHRDLKPENVMLIDMGGWERAKIVDFGIIKLIGDAQKSLGSANLTSMGMVMGTPAYMAPEQALGKGVDGRADLYACAIILFEMVTGRVPFESNDPLDQMRMHCKAPVPRLDQVTRGAPWATPQLVALVEGGLEKDPNHRFRDAPTMIAALDDAFVSIDHVK